MPFSAFAISNNNSMVTNTMTAHSAQVCTGQTKITTCGKMRGSVGIVAGVGVPSTYSMDELAFIKDSGSVGGVSPSNFSGTGTASAGTPSNSATLMCYVLDVDAGAAGTYNFSCEMTGLTCNKLYRYHFAGSHTTAGAAEHSNTNTTNTSLYFYTTACAPGAGTTDSVTQTTANVSRAITNGALAQTLDMEWGTTTAYGNVGTITSGGTVNAANSGTTTVAASMTGLTCGTTYHYRFNATTNDGAVNGSTLVNGTDQTVTTSPCATTPTATTGAASGVTSDSASLAGTVNDNWGTTTVSFEYGTSNALGSTQAATTGGTISAGTGVTAASATLTGLQCGTTYSFRIKGVNSAGTGLGSIQTFTTAACPVAQIPPLSTVPSVPGTNQPSTVLDLAAGNGPAMTSCLVDALARTLGGSVTYLGQSATGAVSLLWNGQTVVFYPISSTNTGSIAAGVQLLNNNPLTVNTSCGTLSTTPALANVTEFGAAMQSMGLAASIGDTGVITVLASGVYYVGRPDYLISPETGSVRGLVITANGQVRFVYSNGTSQRIYPAFLDPAMLRSALATDITIQTDGTALATLNGRRVVLTPDLTLGGVPSANAAEYGWQDGTNRFRYRIFTVPGFAGNGTTSQGYTVSNAP